MTRVNLFSVYNIQYQHIISQFGKYLLNKTLEDFAQQNSGDFGDFFFSLCGFTYTIWKFQG